MSVEKSQLRQIFDEWFRGTGTSSGWNFTFSMTHNLHWYFIFHWQTCQPFFCKRKKHADFYSKLSFLTFDISDFPHCCQKINDHPQLSALVQHSTIMLFIIHLDAISNDTMRFGFRFSLASKLMELQKIFGNNIVGRILILFMFAFTLYASNNKPSVECIVALLFWPYVVSFILKTEAKTLPSLAINSMRNAKKNQH